MSANYSIVKRIDFDVFKLIEKNFQVYRNEKINEISVRFYGPSDTPYEGGIWLVNVHIPKQYPFKSPSIGFMNKIFHPNIDDNSGTICLDIINENWSPAYGLLNIFEIFLPQLLAYPNAESPLNSTAASMYLINKDEYNHMVQEYMKKYASEESIRTLMNGICVEMDTNSDSLSDLSEDGN